ncbi:zinc dependent phospholipase C family protein [Jingyaoa shaoxingensis]|uniref:Zinc dependent phospholipase C family protein n=1 Tax=Jingyaoa shaoxingensis TaxID=2763671 RepID=A0ABR7NDK9_9FIRM|nr:zinc dependent phospholipase C family protein [Jingyaoa shaoxingensis]MBC8574487.1 zinc dependent phospholipase C family protein [Jingyaoa shaoxingensis]
MPTTYAHDLFGKMVYHRLDPEIQEKIKKYQTTYQIGLHGPDILFYVRPFHKNRFNQMAHRLHREEAAGFFERGRELYQKTGNEEILVYLLGFICHFMLDSTCHPYISEYMKKTGARHDEIETEFDRALMVRTGKDPFHYQPGSVIRIEKNSVDAISEVMEGMSHRDIVRALMGSKFYTRLPICDSEKKRKIKLAVARILFMYRLADGRIIRGEPKDICLESTQHLTQLFRQTVPEAATMINEYYKQRNGSDRLNVRFDRNYK